MSDLQYWLALHFLTDVGPVSARNLLAAFGRPEDIFHAPMNELVRVDGVGEKRARSIVSFKRWDSVSRELGNARRMKVRIVTINDPDYPPRLKQITGAPLALYVRGDMSVLRTAAVAMVGSRDATPYGSNVAEGMSYRLAASGLTVVSGMARGIDTAAHCGALQAGRTIAVLGSGINVPYPASNRKLMESIAATGAVVSEFPLGTRPSKESFPRRNRIISGLSLGVIVVEAALDSGSLITVAYALEQGREVFAVPGNITSQHSRGTNDLIKRGARLVESAEEVIDDLRPQLGDTLSNKKDTTPEMNQDERIIYDYLGMEPKHIDTITREFNMATGKALSLLLSLELKGIVRQNEGKCFSRR